MTAEWVALAHELGEIDADSSEVLVSLESGRKQTISVVEHDDGWEISGLGATPTTMERIGLTPEMLWQRNRTRRLTGFVVDDEGAWVSARVPRAGLSPDEFQLVAIGGRPGGRPARVPVRGRGRRTLTAQ